MLLNLFTIVASFATLVFSAPCDIYTSGGTPCVAAHSTTRALYSNYTGPLYQVQRGSDNTTLTITPLSTGGIANSTAQGAFCSGTTCLITTIFDQSPQLNHLTVAPPGGAASGPNPGGFDELSSAVAAPVLLNGAKAYGVFIHPTSGYRNNAAVGTATADQPQGMYAIFDGTHYNGDCCFDYGNAETNSLDNGNGHMEAIYFGTANGYGKGSGAGPWVMADLENGIFSQDNGGVNENYPTLTSRFITAVVKGEPGTWSIRAGDSTEGNLTTYWNGARPSPGYDPMSKEGAIILGTGGDNSISGQGTFYEGVMTTGYPSDDTENAVQADIINAGYTVAEISTGPALSVNSTVSFRLGDSYLAHNSNTISTSASPVASAATFTVRSGLANSGCFSFESLDTPGSYIRHYNFQLQLDANDGSKLFGEDATHCTEAGFAGSGTTGFRSYNYPVRYWRTANGSVYVARNGGPRSFDGAEGFAESVSWTVEKGLAGGPAARRG